MKNRQADLFNIAPEKVVEAGSELPGFSTLDKMASKNRTEVNASICAGIHDRMSPISGQPVEDWVDGIAARKITDFAGEADAADAPALRDYVPAKRLPLIAYLVHKARMRVRDDLATMFCKRVATKIKKVKTEPEEIRLAEREITEALIGNYRTVLKDIDGFSR